MINRTGNVNFYGLSCDCIVFLYCGNVDRRRWT